MGTSGLKYKIQRPICQAVFELSDTIGAMASKQLSKSDYLMYLKQPAWLWLKKHEPRKLPAPDASLQAMFDDGNLFETIVEQQFVGLTRLGFENYQEYLSLPKRTQDLIAAGDKLISQARFEHEQLTCICDVIEVVGEGEVDLWEIKASTKVKPEHIVDLAFQVVVLEGAGYRVRQVGVMYCNNRYVRKGEVDPKAITMRTDVTADVKAKLEATKREIPKALEVMNLTKCPDISPARARGGGFREWLDIYKTLQPPSSPYSIYALCRPDPQILAELENRGVAEIADIPEDMENELKPAQARQVAATKQGVPIIETAKIQKFLDGLSYPLYFLDYETLASVVPPFDGLRPYEQLPFQYSLHIIDGPGGDARHFEYLHESSDVPGPKLLEQMSHDIGPTGTVLVWYEGFEKACNELMAKLWPEQAKFLHGVNDRVVDLMWPFSKGWYVDRGFFGSASIKKVLPALMPELKHSDLEVSDGATAQRAWMQAVLGGVDEGKAKLMQDLRDYCELDTLAMVKIYEYLVHMLAHPDDHSGHEPTQPSLF